MQLVQHNCMQKQQKKKLTNHRHQNKIVFVYKYFICKINKCINIFKTFSQYTFILFYVLFIVRFTYYTYYTLYTVLYLYFIFIVTL